MSSLAELLGNISPLGTTKKDFYWVPNIIQKITSRNGNVKNGRFEIHCRKHKFLETCKSIMFLPEFSNSRKKQIKEILKPHCHFLVHIKPFQKKGKNLGLFKVPLQNPYRPPVMYQDACCWRHRLLWYIYIKAHSCWNYYPCFTYKTFHLGRIVLCKELWEMVSKCSLFSNYIAIFHVFLLLT